MNATVGTKKNQEKQDVGRKISRKNKKQELLELSPEEKKGLQDRMQSISEGMMAYTWKDLELPGKFSKNEKLSFIDEKMLIVGCDVGSDTHYARAIDVRGRELSERAFQFENNEEGFQSLKSWALELAAKNEKEQIVMGLEPTGHYWFALAAWMVDHEISVVQVNPYAVKQSKELEDNSQAKNDRKDPKLIANLVKDGNYGMPYLPEEVYADMRVLSRFRDQLQEDHGRMMNRLHREMRIVFPEYQEAFGKMDGIFALSIITRYPLPSEIVSIGEEGIREIWHEYKLRGRGCNRAKTIVQLAETSVGVVDGSPSRKTAIISFAKKLIELEIEINEIEEQLQEACRKIPQAENVLAIKGLGENIVSGILSEIGDIRRFDDAKEIQKLSGLSLVSISSGKYKGQTKISRRGRKRLRYWLYQGAMSVVSHNEEFKEIHQYYTTRAVNPLKKMQSIVAIACKLLRIIFVILTKGVQYDPQKMLKDIVRPELQVTAA